MKQSRESPKAIPFATLAALLGFTAQAARAQSCEVGKFAKVIRAGNVRSE